jgi:release factor glutamine methyltransferase
MLQRDWGMAGWTKDLGRFDLIIANPPYVEQDAPLAPSVMQFEPAGALFAGKDGLDDYHLLLPQLPGLLRDGGLAVLEIGAMQGDAVRQIAEANGFLVELRKDLGSRPRALVLRLGLGNAGLPG